MIYPVWPLFVSGVLGASMTALGVIDGLGEALVSISQAASGYLSDRWRRRKVFIWTGYLAGSLSRIGYSVSATWQMLIPFKVLDRAGKMRGAPRDAIIADISTDDDRGRNFGLLRTMDNLGAVAGIVLCIFLFDRLGYRVLFLLAAIPSAAGALLVFLLIRESPRPAGKVFRGIALSALGPDFKLFLITSSVFALGSFSYSFLLLFSREHGVSNGFVPVMYLIFSVFASLSALPFGRLSDRIGRKRVFLLSLILWVGVLLCFLFSRTPLTIIPAFVLYGLHRGALEPSQKTFVSELSPVEFRASGIGGFQMVVGMCALPASFAAGLLWDTFGMSAPLLVSLSLTLMSVLLLAFVREQSRGNPIKEDL